MDFTVLLNFLTAMALGALIGVERQRQKSGGFAGLRTFVMIAFLGALTAFLYQELGYSLILVLIFLSIVALITSSYVISALKGHIGITAEISAYICFFLGFIVMFEEFRNYGLIFGVLITILLSFKGVVHKFIAGAKAYEWNDTLKFALIAFVILPILPKEITLPIFPEGQFSHLNVFHLQEIWLLVVFVCGISFVGYFLLKTLDTKRGANLIGTLGGIVSSTAVTQSMAVHSRAKIAGKVINHKPLVISVLLATLVSFGRVGVISTSIHRSLIQIVVPIVILVAVGFLIFLILSKNQGELKTKLKLESPFKLKPALILGLLYASLTFISKLSFAANLGKSGVVLSSIVTGFFDIDPVILTVSSLASAGSLGAQDAICAILLAVGSNQITKSFVALTSGSQRFGNSVAKILALFTLLIIGWVGVYKFM